MSKPPMLSNPLLNRIIGHGEESVAELLANPLNFRIHSELQQSALAGSIDEIGFIRSLTVNKRTGRVVDGHLRVTLALRSGVDLLPVEYVDLSEDEERKALLSLDPIAQLAGEDDQKLTELISGLEIEDQRFQEFIDGLVDDFGLDLSGDYPAEDPGPKIELADELRKKWNTETGQVWRLGRHLIVCGDSTVENTVSELFREDDPGKVSLIVTDPPWGVNYDGGAGNKVKRSKLSGDEDSSLYERFLAVAPIADKCALYMWHGGIKALEVYKAALKAGFEVRSQIIWNKLNAHYGAYMAQYKQKHEPCLYCVKNSPEFVGPTNEVSVWEYDQPNVSKYHPTEKPVELMERSIKNHPYELVYDPFLGSGTTLIACERNTRACRGVEIDPAYIAVILERWSEMTGLTPELVRVFE